jgi:hypothetical protein
MGFLKKAFGAGRQKPENPQSKAERREQARAEKDRRRKRKAKELFTRLRLQAETQRRLRMAEVEKEISPLLKNFKDEQALDSRARHLNELAVRLANNRVDTRAGARLNYRGLGMFAPPLLSEKQRTAIRGELDSIRGDFISYRAYLERGLFLQKPAEYAKWRKSIPPEEKGWQRSRDIIFGLESVGLEIETLKRAFPGERIPELSAWADAIDAIARELHYVRTYQYAGLPKEQVLNFYFTSVNLAKIKQLRKLLGM